MRACRPDVPGQIAHTRSSTANSITSSPRIIMIGINDGILDGRSQPHDIIP